MHTNKHRALHHFYICTDRHYYNYTYSNVNKNNEQIQTTIDSILYRIWTLESILLRILIIDISNRIPTSDIEQEFEN